MKTVLLQLLSDFLSALIFLVVFALSGQLVLATIIAVAVALAQVGYNIVRQKPMSTMQWMSLALVIVLSGLTVITRDTRFIQLKPSIAHFAIGVVMLKRGWQVPYLPPNVREWLPERMLVGWGYAWAVLMLLMGLANIAAAQWLSLAGWGVFLTGLLVGKLIFFGMQYLAMRIAVRARMRAESAAAVER